MLNLLFKFSVGLPINSRLLLWGSQKLYLDFCLRWRLAPLAPELFRGQLYLDFFPLSVKFLCNLNFKV